MACPLNLSNVTFPNRTRIELLHYQFYFHNLKFVVSGSILKYVVFRLYYDNCSNKALSHCIVVIVTKEKFFTNLVA